MLPLAFFIASLACFTTAILSEPLLINGLLNNGPVQVGNTQLPLCAPPVVSGLLTAQLPKSAVTTRQTGRNCNKYGNPPARVVGPIESPDGLQNLIHVCAGKIVHITDNLGEDRVVCMYINPASTVKKPLPLVVWLQPSVLGETISFPLTGWDEVKTTQQLNNEDPSARGFSYIVPVGRNTEHKYPIPDNVGVGWDNWYRNLDRHSKGLNADVDLIDKAIALAKKSVPVDHRRVFMSGWSNGAAMALLYVGHTDGIASASVYSAPDPYRDSLDPCTQVPHPKYATPTRDVHNFCDIIGICTTALYYYNDLKKRYPKIFQSFVVISDISTDVVSRDESARCDPLCRGSCAVTRGTAAHVRWPKSRNSDTFFEFFKNHPLPKSGSWGSPR